MDPAQLIAEIDGQAAIEIGILKPQEGSDTEVFTKRVAVRHPYIQD
jgi:hypothetical protein